MTDTTTATASISSQVRFNRSQLISALYHEYQFLCHDDFDPEVDPTPDEYLLMLQHLTDDDLIDESSSDDLDEYIRHWL